MTMTQDKIWEELHTRGSEEWKESRTVCRRILLRKLAPPPNVLKKMDASARKEWLEEQKSLINEYFRLRDKLAPRFVGAEQMYRDEGVNSKEELGALIQEFIGVIKKIELRIKSDEIDGDMSEQWRESVDMEINRAREKLRWLSRLPKEDPRISELLYLYEKWNTEAKASWDRYETARMSRWSLFYSVLVEPHMIKHERNRLKEAVSAEGMRAGVLMALWAFDYAPEGIERVSEASGPIPLPPVRRPFLRED